MRVFKTRVLGTSKKLPKKTRYFLRMLSKVVKLVNENYSETKMDLQSLAVVFAPTFYILEKKPGCS